MSEFGRQTLYFDRKFVLIPLGAYLVWVLSTHMLEGRISLLQEPDPVGRLIYTIVANILIGVILSIWLLRPSIKSKFCSLSQLGFRPIKRTLIAVTFASVLGLLLFGIQGPSSYNPVVIINVFAQTLPTSIAEVLVCWVLVGVAFESLLLTRKSIYNSNKGKKIIPTVIAAVVTSILFGVYHFAHSAPFNQPSMVLLLMYPGVVTSLVYFMGRDVYATIIFHNFQALIGVMASISNIESLIRLSYLTITLGIASIFVLVILDILIIRRIKVSGSVCDTKDRNK